MVKPVIEEVEDKKEVEKMKLVNDELNGEMVKLGLAGIVLYSFVVTNFRSLCA